MNLPKPNPPRHPFDRHVAARLRHLHRQRSLSVEDLEAKIGWPAGMIDRFESGGNLLKAEHLFLLSEALGISVSLLFDGLADLPGGNGKAAAGAPSGDGTQCFIRAHHAIGDTELRKDFFKIVKAAAMVAPSAERVRPADGDQCSHAEPPKARQPVRLTSHQAGHCRHRLDPTRRFPSPRR